MRCWVGTLLLLALAVMSARYTSAQTCTKVDSCSCRMPDGKVVSLNGLRGNKALIDGSLGFDGYTYHFSPCDSALNFDERCSPTIDSAACQEAGDGFYSLGRTSTVSFELLNQDPAQVVFTYTDGTASDSLIRQMKLTVVCDMATTAGLVFDSELPNYGDLTLTYFLTLRSKWGCADYSEPAESSGISAGSVMVIIFFVLLVVYLVGGVTFQIARHQKRGLEMIPNLEFWKSLPGYIKDGGMFVVTCGKAGAGGDGGSFDKKGYEEL